MRWGRIRTSHRYYSLQNNKLRPFSTKDCRRTVGILTHRCLVETIATLVSAGLPLFSGFWSGIGKVCSAVLSPSASQKERRRSEKRSARGNHVGRRKRRCGRERIEGRMDNVQYRRQAAYIPSRGMVSGINVVWDIRASRSSKNRVEHRNIRLVGSAVCQIV